MATIDLQNVREELTHFLRNGDVLSIGIRGVSTTTDPFTATLGQTVFTLTNTAVKNIRTCTVATVAKKLFRDFTMNWNTGVLTLLVGAGSGDAVSIIYDYGTGDHIYPDLPRSDLKITSYPRVGIELTSITTKPFQLGGITHISEILATVIVWVPANKDSAVAGGFGGTENLNDLMRDIRSVIRANEKGFFTTPYIYPMGTNPMIPSEDRKNIQGSQDFNMKFIIET